MRHFTDAADVTLVCNLQIDFVSSSQRPLPLTISGPTHIHSRRCREPVSAEVFIRLANPTGDNLGRQRFTERPVHSKDELKTVLLAAGLEAASASNHSVIK